MPPVVAGSLGAYDAVPLPILIAAEDRVVFVNQACRERFAGATRPLLGQPIWELCAPWQSNEFRRAWASNTPHAQHTIWTTLVDGRGRPTPAVLRVASVMFENVPSRLVVAQEPDLPPLPALDVALTPRERTVLRLMAEGATTSDIAALLQISKQTVRIYIHSLTKKTGVRGRVELSLLARHAIRQGGVEPSDCDGCPRQPAAAQGND